MKVTLRKLVNPTRWRAFLSRQAEARRRERLYWELDAVLLQNGPVALHPGDATLIADGLWFNPNHFARLRLFIEAMSTEGRYRLLGVLRRRADDRQRRAMQRIGFGEFVYLEDDQQFRSAQFLDQAEEMLEGVRDFRDLLQLALPEELPAYVLYDTVLKLAQHPQPPIGQPIWRRTLAELLRNVAIYRRELSARSVAQVVLSHPWKSEWATLLWLALGRSVPVFHLTGFVEAMRIRRFRTRADYADPVESLPYRKFAALPSPVRARLSELGGAELRRRASGMSSDINVRHAFRADRRIDDRYAARCALSGQNERPVAVIYSHVWYDFPHTFAMTNFTDFLDWMKLTLERIRELPETVWLLKPHPTEDWYGGYRLREIARDLPAHVRLLTDPVDSATVLRAADCIVTVHGTVGLEAAAQGRPVILGDRSYFSEWNVGHLARSRADYLRLLGEAGRLAPPDAEAQERAKASFVLALGEPPSDLGAMTMLCDSLVCDAYRQIIGRARRPDGAEHREVARLREFLGQSTVDSYAAFHLLNYAAREMRGVPTNAMAGQ